MGKDKTNKRFMLLSALGIIMVVDAHAWTPVSLFANYIPYNSFFMPMFVFIAGYFLKIDENTSFIEFTKKKVKKLIFPYILYSFIALIIDLIITMAKLGEINIDTFNSIFNLKNIFFEGTIVAIAAPMWFIPTLFVTELTYALIKISLLKIRFWNDFFVLFVFAVINFCIVHFAKHVNFGECSFLLLLKCGFMLFFCQLGLFYRVYLEKIFEKTNSIIIALVLLIINMIRIMNMADPYDIAFNNLSLLNGFTCKSSFTPMISSIIGILFWLSIVKLIEPALKDNKTMNYISNNTFFIMAFHLTMFEILNLIICFINDVVCPLEGFDKELFLTSHWYRWERYSHFRLTYFAIGICGTVLIKKMVDKIKGQYIRRKKEIN